MNPAYDKYYETENLFGAPYPELLDFYANLPTKGKLLDIGCGQGRDAIALARLDFDVKGLDNSAVGITPLNQIAKQEHLPLTSF
jgi:2-polyprenyl-3-methyl-5-hydroxy-6-metoxy-1,4-benzoquinol methylase